VEAVLIKPWQGLRRTKAQFHFHLIIDRKPNMLLLLFSYPYAA
jgi:hypothetical protein